MPKQHVKTLLFDDFATLDEKFEYARSMHLEAKYEEGLSYFRILKDEYEKQRNFGKVMDCLGGICQNLVNLGRAEEVYNYLPEYKSYCNEYGDEITKYKLNVFLGFISSSIGDYDASVKYYQEGLKIVRQPEQKKRYISLLLNLQTIYLLMDQIDMAQTIAFELQEELSRNSQYFSMMSEGAYYLNYSTLLLKLNRLDEVNKYLTGFEQVRGIDMSKRKMMYYKCIKGKYFNLLKQYRQAIPYLQEAHQYLEKTQEQPYYTQNLNNLIEAYRELYDYKKALFYSNELTEYLISEEKHELQKTTLKLTKEMDFENMKELVYTDGLSNIYNRRYLEEESEKWISEANCMNKNLYCAIFDIDLFKEINDQFGHLVGDAAIRHIASVMKDMVRDAGIYARYGGDEFVMIFKEMPHPTVFFQQLFNELSDLEFNFKHIQKAITISMGVASLQQCEDKTFECLLHLADEALYQSKLEGRNQLTIK